MQCASWTTPLACLFGRGDAQGASPPVPALIAPTPCRWFLPSFLFSLFSPSRSMRPACRMTAPVGVCRLFGRETSSAPRARAEAYSPRPKPPLAKLARLLQTSDCHDSLDAQQHGLRSRHLNLKCRRRLTLEAGSGVAPEAGGMPKFATTNRAFDSDDPFDYHPQFIFDPGSLVLQVLPPDSAPVFTRRPGGSSPASKKRCAQCTDRGDSSA